MCILFKLMTFGASMTVTMIPMCMDKIVLCGQWKAVFGSKSSGKILAFEVRNGRGSRGQQFCVLSSTKNIVCHGKQRHNLTCKDDYDYLYKVVLAMHWDH